MNKAQADEQVSILRDIVPKCWKVEARNTESRPGKPERYKVVAHDAGMTIVVHPHSQKVYATVDNGPGLVESVSPRSFGDKGFDDADAAYEKLWAHITARHQRVSRQFASLTSP